MLLVRHAESEWNRVFGPTRIDPGMPDPPITAEGREATLTMAATLAGQPFARIITSPYRRTLQTASILATALGLAVTIEPRVRERCAFTCDQGSHPERLVTEWPHLDFSALAERWWGGAIESTVSLRARADCFLAAAREFPDRDQVLVVTHWGFIRCLTGAEVGNLATVRLSFDATPPVTSG
jgi:broad specificity phosphatase PhoE